MRVIAPEIGAGEEKLPDKVAEELLAPVSPVTR
jgi:hypothetical protein